ncbi:hypothetical protein DSO57_1035163 [Entomophthora muscae]|uniref:Uncharacterized protein n=1 Tax=Entomophthora muscae TaxID=34485 RepID=A0ACC2U983_9FUNG|nr:hypothetical protein DSO57_1035163 [Entomophthora muscae]
MKCSTIALFAFSTFSASQELDSTSSNDFNSSSTDESTKFSATDLDPPTFRPPRVKSKQLETIEVSLIWPFSCTQDNAPTVKLSIDDIAYSGGGTLSSDPNEGFMIYGANDDDEFVIDGNKNVSGIALDGFSTLIYSSSNDVSNEPFTINFLYLAQRVAPRYSNTTIVEIELSCQDQPPRIFSRAKRNAPILSVNNANAASPTSATAFAILVFIHSTI